MTTEERAQAIAERVLPCVGGSYCFGDPRHNLGCAASNRKVVATELLAFAKAKRERCAVIAIALREILSDESRIHRLGRVLYDRLDHEAGEWDELSESDQEFYCGAAEMFMDTLIYESENPDEHRATAVEIAKMIRELKE